MRATVYLPLVRTSFAQPFLPGATIPMFIPLPRGAVVFSPVSPYLFLPRTSILIASAVL
jgi:hypothetical protein